jgi:GxxExxY protein
MMTSSHLLHGGTTDRILQVYYSVHAELGHGFLEKVYQRAMIIALMEANLRLEQSVRLTVLFRGHQIGDFWPDLIVEGVVLLEIKAGQTLENWHSAQVLNYLRASHLEVGLLLNFGSKPEFKRLLLTNDRKIR